MAAAMHARAVGVERCVPRTAVRAPRRGCGLRARSALDGKSNAAQEPFVEESTLRGLSGEARSIFKEAQENIVELNKSRLRAVEELKLARQKIAELEQKLEAAVVEVHEASHQVAGYAARHDSQPASASPATPTAAATPAPPAAAEPPVAAPGSITIVYETGWDSAFLHYNPDGKGWSIVPGSQMLNGTEEFPDKKIISVVANSLEFVINDGGSDWDQPNPYGQPKNYRIDGPGTYRLRAGKIVKID